MPNQLVNPIFIQALNRFLNGFLTKTCTSPERRMLNASAKEASELCIITGKPVGGLAFFQETWECIFLSLILLLHTENSFSFFPNIDSCSPFKPILFSKPIFIIFNSTNKCNSSNSTKHVPKPRKSKLARAVRCGEQSWISELSSFSRNSHSLFLLPQCPPEPFPHPQVSRFSVPTLFPVPLPTGGWHSAACRIVQSIISIRALSCLSVKAAIQQAHVNTQLRFHFPQGLTYAGGLVWVLGLLAFSV